MPDITMCDGGDCPIKESCNRFVSKPSMRQSFFTNIPFESSIIDGTKVSSCKYYWDVSNSANKILKTIK